MQITVSTQISTQLDDTTMFQFGKVCEIIGLTPSNTVGMLIRDFVDRNFLPSIEKEIKTAKKSAKKKPSKLPYGFGCMKDQIWISEDFGSPMEDFKDYM